mmetsp:Transcript_70221/g.146342  ORF Transcript_70221/g.146342 Transcript_70221/m.146342 type:complete len:903 (-) Transcript_70221:2273-4981(-)
MMRLNKILSFALWFAIFEAVNGSYRYGTLSWKHVVDTSPNTVEFELITAWKRDFKWVYVRQARNTDGSARALDDPPIVGDILRVTGLTFADETGMKSTNPGSSAIVVKTGDGSQYFVDVQVTAFSESEDWVMGNFTFRHSYATPYDATAPLHPIYPDGFSYEASTGASLSANQPFQHTPWTATFEGCCRWSESLDPNAKKSYKIHTKLDLTDRNNAPAARTLPVVAVPQAISTALSDQPSFYVLAKDQFVMGIMAPKSMSSSTSNYPDDDNLAGSAALSYKIATEADLGLPGYMPLEQVTVNDTTGLVTVQTNVTSAWPPGHYQLAVIVMSGSSDTVVDFMIRVVPAECQPMNVDRHEMALMGERAARDKVIGWVGYTLSADVWVKNPCPGPNLVLNYVFAGLSVEASSSGPNGVVYNEVVGGYDHQGMPPGAMLGSMALNAIVDVKLSYDNPFDAHRPGHDAAVNKANRDYTNAPQAEQLWADGYRPVLMQGKNMGMIKERAIPATISMAAFNMNSGTGGAAVYMWIKRGGNEPAITEFAISTNEAEEDAAEVAGFTKIDMDVNEQSSSPDRVYVWYKKGSGAAINDIKLVDLELDGPFTNMTYEPIEGCPTMYAQSPKCNLNSGTETRMLFMYVRKVPQGVVRRLLHWVPQSAGHFLLCYSGTVPGMADHSSTQRCIDIDVRQDRPPMFEMIPAQSTLMGQTLHFPVAFTDINHPDEMVHIGIDSTGLTLSGAILGDPMHEVVDGRTIKTTRMVEWFPDALYGGFEGDVCFTATDSEGPGADMVKGCVSIKVERCMWHVQSEDTLIQIAARFGTNWLQIWHFNPEILHPDSSLPPNQAIHIGHLYEVEPNDALAVLAERFGTSIKHIMMNNWDLEDTLEIGKHICVIPNSCVTAQHVLRT